MRVRIAAAWQRSQRQGLRGPGWSAGLAERRYALRGSGGHSRRRRGQRRGSLHELAPVEAATDVIGREFSRWYVRHGRLPYFLLEGNHMPTFRHKGGRLSRKNRQTDEARS